MILAILSLSMILAIFRNTTGPLCTLNSDYRLGSRHKNDANPVSFTILEEKWLGTGLLI